MTTNELELVAELLEMAANEFGNHGCNDTHPYIFRNFTEDELIVLTADYHQYNGDPFNHVTFDRLPDYAIMSYFSYKLKIEWMRADKAESHD